MARVENVFEFSVDRAERLALEKGREQGIEQGIERGIERGIEKKCHEAVNRMLTRGMPEEQILDVLQLSVEQLEKIKRQIKN